MKFLGLIILFVFTCFQVQSQTYYWVGDSGNWSDTMNWAASSGGTGGVFSTYPDGGAQVVFDTSSFSGTGHTVTFDVGSTSISSMRWDTGTDAPTFVSASANDSISIDGSMFLEMSMTYNYAGLLFFTGGTNDTIFTANKTLLNDIYVNTFDDTLRVVGSLTSNGGLFHNRGGLFFGQAFITLEFFSSIKNTTRTLGVNNTSFILTGSTNAANEQPVLDIVSGSTLTRSGSGENFSFNYTGTDTLQIGVDTTIVWGPMEFWNRNLHFIRNSASNKMTSTFNSVKYIELDFNNILVCDTFDIDGTCGELVQLYSPNGASKVDGGLSGMNLDFYRLKNINAVSAGFDGASQSLDEGGNSGWSILEDVFTQDYYWVGGTGNYYDPTHWATTPGGIPDACIPGPNDRIFFDFFSAPNDTLFIDGNVIVREMNFSTLSNPFVIAGQGEYVEIRENLLGSNQLTVLWDGDFNMTGKWPSGITSNTTVWNNDFIQSGDSVISIIGDFVTLGDYFVNGGTLTADTINFTVSSFYSTEIANNRSISFDSSWVNITGPRFEVDSTNITAFDVEPSTLSFIDSVSAVEFYTGGYDYDTVIINAGSVDIKTIAVDYRRLVINAGSTIILENGSIHLYDTLEANGTCVEPIIIKSSNALAPQATMVNGVGDTTTVDYAIIDHVNAATIGLYIATNSVLLNQSNNWSNSATLSTVTVPFTSDTTISGGATASFNGTLTLPANAVVMYSTLSLDSVSTNGGTILTDCEVTLTGASTLAATYLSGPATSVTDTMLTLTPTSTLNAGGAVTLSLRNDTLLHTAPFGDFIVDSAHLTVYYYIEYQPAGNTYYWYGDEGDWSDINHWSLNSGNIPPAPATCLPSTRDTVIFDMNSFSTPDQTVTVDVQSYFSVMDWSTSTMFPTLLLDQSLTASGDVTLEKDMTITRNNTTSNFFFQPQDTLAELDTDSTIVEVPIVLISNDLNDTLELVNTLMTSDSTVIIIGGGIFNTNDFDISSGSFLVGSDSPKAVNFGSSTVALRNGFSDDSFGSSLALNSGTSHIIVDDNNQVFENYFRSAGHTFYDVTLNFNSTFYSPLTGNNSFNNLTVGAGSKVQVGSGSTQTVTGELSAIANCLDSIFFSSSADGVQYNFIKSSDTAHFEVVNIQDFNASGGALFQALFSTNAGNNNGLTFAPGAPTTASITTIDNICFGDTTTFVNASTAYSGDTSDLTFYWEFDDGDTHTGDTTQHYYSNVDTYTIQLISEYTNFCRDTTTASVNILNPSANLSASATEVCVGDTIDLSASALPNIGVDFQYFINGVSQNTPTDSLTSLNGIVPTNMDTILVRVDTMGCQAYSDTIFMTVNPRPTTGLFVSDSVICAGDSVTFKGLGAEEYQFFKNGVAITPYMTDSLVLTNVAHNDTFHVVGKYSATDCDASSDTIIFTVYNLPSVTLAQSDADQVICAGDPVTFTVDTVGIGNYFYLQNGTIANTSTSQTWTTTTIPNSGVISAYVQDTNGCYSPVSNSFNFFVNSIPTPTIASTSTTICSGESITLTGSGASQYQFVINGTPVGSMSGTSFLNVDTLTTNASIVVNGQQSGCIGASSPVAITVAPTPVTTLTTTPGASACAGDTVVFTGTSGITANFEFELNGTVVSPLSPTNTYSNSTLNNNDVITVTATAGSCTYTTSQIMTVNPTPSPNIFSNDINNSICEGESITITGTSGALYEFFSNGVSMGAQGAQDFVTTTALPSGVNNIYVEVVNGFGCEATSATMPVTVTAIPSVGMTSTQGTTVCSGTQVDFVGTAGASEYQFFVNGISQGLPSTNNTYSSNALFDGDTVSLIGYNGTCSNPSNDTIYLTVEPSPTASLTGTLAYCEGTSEIFTAGGGTMYEFFIDGVSQGVPSATNAFDGSVIPSGNHTVQVTAVNGSCSDDAVLNVSILSNPTVAITGNASICSGESVLFTGSGAQLYEFFVNGASQGASVNNTFTSTTLNNGDVVTLTGESPGGCASQNTASVTLNVSPTPAVTLIDDDGDFELCENQTVVFTANGATNYEFFVNGFSQGAPSATNTFTTSTLTNGQTVTVIGESNGCSNSPSALNYTVYGYPLVNLTNNDDTTLCVGELTDLTGSGATEYLFYVNGAPQGVFGASPNFNSALANGDIVTLEGRTNNCATTAPESVQYSVFNYPNTVLASSDIDYTICAGESVTFTGSGASTYEFFVDGLLQPTSANTFTTTDLNDGETISLIGYNADCPTTAPQAFTFTVNEMNLSMVGTPADYMLCEGEPLTIDASGADEYEIFVNGISQGAQSTTSTFVLNGLNMGDYITLNGFNSTTGCTQADNETIYPHVFDTPAISIFDNTTICEGDSTILVSSELHGNQWFLDGSPIAGATDTSITVFNTGDYSLEITNGGNGELWSVGYNANGEFGDGTNFNSSTPIEALNLTDVATINARNNHALALLSTGELYSWGDNGSGQLGDGTYTASNAPNLVTGVPAAASVGAGGNFSVLVSTTGDVFVWGENNDGQLGLNNTITYNVPQLVIGLNNLTEVATGSQHTLLLRNDGTVWAAGNNDFGQLGIGTTVGSTGFVQVPGLTNIVKIETGDYHSMAIDVNDELYVWGNNSQGQLGLNDVSNRLDPTLSPLRDVIDVDGGNAHTIMSTVDGEAYATGANNFGQLGTGDLVDRLLPTQLTVDAVQTVSTGAYHSLFQKNDGSVWAAGRNDNHQLANLPVGSVATLSRIETVEGVVEMEAGLEASHFIYGTSKSCVSSVTTITVEAAPQPVISETGGVLTSSETGVSYQWYIDGIEVINSNAPSIPATEDGYYTVLVTYANGCMPESEPFPYGQVSISELAANDYKVFPNPTEGVLTVELGTSSVQQIRILDVLGRVVVEVDALNKEIIQLDLSALATGNYNLQLVESTNKMEVIRIIKH